MDVDIAQLEQGLPGFFQRLLPGHSDIREQMRVEVTEHLALAVPRPSKVPEAPIVDQGRTPVSLMKSETSAGGMQSQGWHRQAPRPVKSCLELSHSPAASVRQTMLSPACHSFTYEVEQCARACHH
jgi:hypothetical protein